MNKKTTQLTLILIVVFQYVSLEAVWPFSLWQGLGGPAVEKAFDGLKDPVTKTVKDNIGSNFGNAAVKGLNEIVNNPATQKISEGFGKDAGSTAATALAGAAVTSTGIIAAVAVAGGTAYAVDKAIDRYYPLPQEQANREEATTRVIGAKIQNVRAAVTLEEAEDEAAFTRCIKRKPKQVRNTHRCPGSCQNLYRSLVLAHKKQLADDQLATLEELDEAPLMHLSAEQGEKQLEASFKKNKDSKETRVFKLKRPTRMPFLTDSIDISLPKESVDLLSKIASLSPKRFARVLEKEVQNRAPDIEIRIAPKFNEHGDCEGLTGTWK